MALSRSSGLAIATPANRTCCRTRRRLSAHLRHRRRRSPYLARRDMVSDTCPTTPTTSVGLTTTATDPDGDTLLYTYSTTGGRITGDGANATWDLSGLAPGTYTASVEVDDGCGCVSFSSTTVTITECPDCRNPLVCPTLGVTCPGDVDEGQPATFTANFSQGTPTVSETYNWTVSAGTITSGQGTSSITVDTTGVGGGSDHRDRRNRRRGSELQPHSFLHGASPTEGWAAQVRRVRQHSFQRREGQTRQLRDSVAERSD